MKFVVLSGVCSVIASLGVSLSKDGNVLAGGRVVSSMFFGDNIILSVVFSLGWKNLCCRAMICFVEQILWTSTIYGGVDVSKMYSVRGYDLITNKQIIGECASLLGRIVLRCNIDKEKTFLCQLKEEYPVYMRYALIGLMRMTLINNISCFYHIMPALSIIDEDVIKLAVTAIGYVLERYNNDLFIGGSALHDANELRIEGGIDSHATAIIIETVLVLVQSMQSRVLRFH